VWVIGSSQDRRLVLCSLNDKGYLAVGRNTLVKADTVIPTGLIGGSYPRYSSSNHVLYMVGSTLMALPFDGARRRVLGPSVPVMESVRRESFDAAAQYAIADDGTLVFARGGDASKSVMVQVDRTGRIVDTLAIPVGDYFNVFLSPTGKRLAYATYLPSGKQSVSLFDVERGLTREVEANEEARFNAWWPSGEDAIFHLGYGPGSFAWGSDLSKAAAQTGGAWRIGLEGAHARDSLLPPGMHINAVSRNLKYLAVFRYGDSAGVYHLSADGKRQNFLQTRGGWPSFSPDNQWLAFIGSDGLRITAVVGGASQIVAPASADEPTWSPRGDELYYRDANRWMVLSIASSNGALIAGKPRLLFSGPFLNVRAKSYDIGPDGRFLLLLGPPEQTIGQLEVVTDFFTELRRLSPVGTQKAGR